MTGTPSLFRVFDVAFFVPGALVLGAAHYAGLVPISPALSDANVASVRGLIAAVTAVGLIYIIGVLIHAMQEALVMIGRYVRRLLGRSRNDRSPWYRKRSGGAEDELAYYFWYMRATCANLAAASLLLAVGSAVGRQWALTAALALLAIPFAWLAHQFDRGLYGCLDYQDQRRTTHDDASAGRASPTSRRG